MGSFNPWQDHTPLHSFQQPANSVSLPSFPSVTESIHRVTVTDNRSPVSRSGRSRFSDSAVISTRQQNAFSMLGSVYGSGLGGRSQSSLSMSRYSNGEKLSGTNQGYNDIFFENNSLLSKRKSNSVDIPVNNTNQLNSRTNMYTGRRKNSFNVPRNFEVDAWLEEFYSSTTVGPENDDQTDPFDRLIDSKILEEELRSSCTRFHALNTQPRKKCNSPKSNREESETETGGVDSFLAENRPQATRTKKGKSPGTKPQTRRTNDPGRKTLQRSKSLPERPRKRSSKPRQRRLKWSVTELFQLWSGIREHGNEWREVEKNVKNRTYHQIKDKGRRLLQTESWVTGKTKKDTESAKQVAKDIAQEVLERYATTGRLSRDDEEEGASSGSPYDTADFKDDLLFPERYLN